MNRRKLLTLIAGLPVVALLGNGKVVEAAPSSISGTAVQTLPKTTKLTMRTMDPNLSDAWHQYLPMYLQPGDTLTNYVPFWVETEEPNALHGDIDTVYSESYMVARDCFNWVAHKASKVVAVHSGRPMLQWDGHRLNTKWEEA